MKIAICAIIKNENLYLREWIEYHKRLGFDKIIIYDNNPVDGEVPHQVIGDYVMDGYVDVHNIRGYEWLVDYEKNITVQKVAYRKCINEYKDTYKWIAFIDIDEFITIADKEPQDIHELFKKYKYEDMGYEQLLMHWYLIGDLQINYNDKPVQSRFFEHKSYRDVTSTMSEEHIKSILRTDALGDRDIIAHCVNGAYSCDEHGNWIVPGDYGVLAKVINVTHDIIYVKHYWSKSLWEHLSRQRNICKESYQLDNRIGDYKQINGWTDEHQKILNKFIEYVDNVEDISVNVKIKRKV